MNNSNVCILILSTKAESYRCFITAIENSWYKDAIDRGFKVFFYSGGHLENCLYSHNEIRVAEDDSIENCYRKFVSAKNILLSEYPDIKLIYRTNLSSYIDIPVLIKYIQKCSFDKDSYHGYLGKANLLSQIFSQNKFLYSFFKYFFFGPKVLFFSGAGFFIGINLCNGLSLDDSKKYLIDDVEIGRQILKFRRHDSEYERIYITDSFSKITKNELDSLVADSLLFHYKFKTSNRYDDAEYISKFSDLKYRYNFLTV
ncbi:hypothetical protein EKM01_08655 [Flavobacterium sp. RSP46]|uniref:hypothetical protein n=1 Tax=Flavobacterium sp. RSP46 TaxID=2497486 RepID=UPI000F87B78A|nr:hypothetical protein [Flavobacterium sp. RSP46]RTY91099.1 hypothetical protein EKM01_08655 [Flavobacterium sp. RSP46]